MRAHERSCDSGHTAVHAIACIVRETIDANEWDGVCVSVCMSVFSSDNKVNTKRKNKIENNRVTAADVQLVNMGKKKRHVCTCDVQSIAFRTPAK